jgi:putative polyketide hydroxylase
MSAAAWASNPCRFALMSSKRVPVLIVGGGAAGLAASALLDKYGVDSLLVERRHEIFLYPKARVLTFPTFEIFRGLGLGDEVARVVAPPTELVITPTLNSTTSERGLGFDRLFDGFEGLSPEPAGRYCPQNVFEPMLLAEIRRRGNDVRYDTEFVSFEQDENGVTATIRDLGSDEIETIRADYLIAADGPRSHIRDALGIGTDGLGALPIFVVFMYFRGPWRKFFPEFSDGDSVQIKNDEVNGVLLTAKGDLGLFIVTYLPAKGESVDQFTPEHCKELILKAVGEQIDIEVTDITAWQPNERVAQQYQSGRVFLVGDSAQAMAPFKGAGANTAIQSANNLCWKLAAVLHGQAGPALLDTYHVERRPVGRFNARQSLHGPAAELLDLGPDAPELSDEKPIFALVLGYQYRSTAVVTDELAAPWDPDTPVLVDELRGQPGTRVPHAWVTRGGKRVSTLDLIGEGFTLFAGDTGAAWRAAAEEIAAVFGVPITVWRIGPDGDTLDPEDRWAEVSGLACDGALLVRPDNFVGWRAEQLPDEPAAELRRVLAAILARS